MKRSIARALAPRTAKISFTLVTLVAGVICFTPGFDVLGYYAGLVIAVVGGLLAGFTGAAACRRALEADDAPLWRGFAAAASSALLLAALPALLLAANALRVKNCDLLEGAAFYLVGPLASMLFSSQLGAALALLSRRVWPAQLLFFGAWLAWALRDLAHFYLHPPIFAFNPFVGFVSGAVYDDVIVIDERYLLYRLSNLLFLAAVAALAAASWDPLRRRATVGAAASASRTPWIVLTVAATAWAAMYGARNQLGYEVTRAYVEAELGGRIENERLTVIYDERLIGEHEAALLLEDHTFRLEQIETTLGRTFPRHIRSYVYADPERKKRLMGAHRTFIAKPWNDEIHLNRTAYGAPVIHHELAHVVLGAFAPGPLHVPAAWGLFPHMALVEGAAEALEWDGGRLSLHGWSAAMREEAIAPELQAIVGPRGFWSQYAGKAYTLAGSFIRWLLETRGPERLLDAYADGDLERAYGQPLDALVAGWARFVDAIEPSKQDLALARHAFGRKGIFERVCAFEVARQEARGRAACDAGRDREALDHYRAVVEHVPADPNKRAQVVEMLSLLGDADAATVEAEAVLASEAADSVLRAWIGELLGDARWRAGRYDAARGSYLSVLGLPQTETRERNVRVKLAILDDPAREPILGPYLLGRRVVPEHGSREEEERVAAEDIAYLMAAVDDLPGDPLALYLLGRRLLAAWHAPEAAQVLASANARLSPPAEAAPWSPTGMLVLRESTRLLAVSLYLAGRYEDAIAAFERAQALTPYTGRKIELGDWLERVRWRRASGAEL